MKKFILGAVFLLATLSPALTHAEGLTTVQANNLIAVVQAGGPSVPASAYANLITAFSNITTVQANSLIVVVQGGGYNVPASAYVNLLISFTGGTSTTQPTLSVDLKVSGSKEPLTLSLNQKITASWISNGTSCELLNVKLNPSDSGNQAITNLPPTSSRDVYYDGANGNIITRCSNAVGDIVYDYVVAHSLSPTATAPTQISVPTISYINPTSSTVGSTVYVYGMFGSNPYIQFDGKKVDTTIVPNDKITETVLSFVVPSYANVGNHSVQVDGTVGTPSVTMVGPSVTLNVTLAQQTTTSQPSVTVTYPTSGINFSPGQTISITWATSGLSSNANYTVIYSKTGGDVPIGTYTSTQAHCDASNKCYVSWTIPNITDSNISVTVFETISGKVGGSGLFSIGSAVPTISVSGGTPTAVVTILSGQPDTGSYTIPFTVTAGDADVYISRYATRTTNPTSPTGGVNFDMTVTSTPNATSVAGETVTVSNSVVGDVGNAYKIIANTSRAFTLNVHLKAVADGYDGIRLTGINYGATSALGSSYTSNLGSFKTNDVMLTFNR